MTSLRSADSAAGVERQRLLPALLLLFVCSGACALIYEVVWFQLLELVIGSTAVSLGVLLATYMGGMCIGSLALPRFVPARQHPLRVYAYLEFGIGVFGVMALLTVPLVSGVYSTVAGHGFLAVLLRAFVCVLILLPPAVLMGATLPALSRWLESTPQGVSWMGFLYGANTAGAVIGCVLAGFYLLRVYDLVVATVVAFAANCAVAAVALALAGGTKAEAPVTAPASSVPAREPGSWAIYVTIALSGACALGAQVVWTRLLSLLLGGTVYTFSMILAVFLTGLGLGSAAGSWLGRVVASPRAVLGWCQLLQTAGIAWAAVVISSALPYWPINPSLAPSPWFTFQLDLTRTIWVVLPSALLWGASFPLALAAAATRNHDPGRLVSGIYAANTVGAIVGSLAFSIFLIPAIGTQKSQQLLIAMAAVSAALVFLIALKPSGAAAGKEAVMQPGRGSRAWTLVPAFAVALLLIAKTPAVPSLLVAYGRYMVTWLNMLDVQYVGEGMNSSVAVSTLRSNGATQFHVSGKVEASTLPQDMRLQRMLGHLPALVHPDPRSVLIVGFGAGVTSGSFVPYPDINRIVICEIEPLIPQVVSRYFAKENNNVLNDSRTQVIYDDARSVMNTLDEKFDIITSDPIHPWVKGAASLYTREYFEAVKAHLNPGGVVSQWVPLYESTPEAVKSEIATFFEAFPNATIWANNNEGQGYDVVLLAQQGGAKIDLNMIRQRLDDPRYLSVASSLIEVGFTTPLSLFTLYTGQASDLQPWLRDAAINRDRNLRLMYLAAVGLNKYESGAIFNEIFSYRRFPESLFTGDDWLLRQLRADLSSVLQ